MKHILPKPIPRTMACISTQTIGTAILTVCAILYLTATSCLAGTGTVGKQESKRVYTWLDHHSLLGMERDIPLSLFYGEKPIQGEKEFAPSKYEIIRVCVYDYGQKSPDVKEGLVESFTLRDLSILIDGKDVRAIPAVVRLTNNGPKIVDMINTRPVRPPDPVMLLAVSHCFLIRRPRNAELKVVYGKQPRKLLEFTLSKENKADKDFLYSLLTTAPEAMSALMKQIEAKKPPVLKSLK